MDKTRKKKLRQVILWCGLAALVLLLAVMPLLAGKAVEDANKPVILSGTVEQGSIDTVLSGGGSLTEDAAVEITIPQGVKLKEFLVNNGDSVSKGDALAAVDTVSVMSTIMEVQKTLDYISGELREAETQKGQTELKSKTAGKVKLVYAAPGDSVQDVMLEHGALAVLSLDSRMAVDVAVKTDLRAGDSVKVILPDETALSGRVESSLGELVTVSIADSGNYPVGQEVTLRLSDGTELGSGELYIHNPWKVTAYTGKVAKVNVKENETVSAGRLLFKLEDTEHNTGVQLLTAERQEYEEVMQRLFAMYQSGVLTAPCDGFVSGVDTESAHLLSAQEGQWFPQLLGGSQQEWQVMLLADETPTKPDKERPSVPVETQPEETTPQLPSDGKTYQVWAVWFIREGQGGNWTVYAAGTPSDSIEGANKDPALMVAQQGPINESTVVDEFGIPIPVYAGDILLHVRELEDGEVVADYWYETGIVVSPDLLAGMMGGMDLSGLIGQFGGMGQTETPFVKFDLTENTVLSVTPPELLKLDITVDELDIRKVYVDQQVRVKIPALDREVTGSVTDIGTAVNSGGNSKFTVSITLERMADVLAGMSGQATIVLDTQADVPVIPVAAVVDNGTQVLVYTGYDEAEEVLTDPVTVELGVSDGENVQILSGLEPGDTFYYSYFEPKE